MAHLLIADDDPQIGTLLARMLGSQGHQVGLAHDGRAAMAYLKGHPDVALMLLDVLMPDQDGIETVMALARQPAKPRIVMMSGGSDRLGRSYLMSVVKLMSVDGILDKPFTREQLFAVVDQALAKGPVTPPSTPTPTPSPTP
jgi:CheY-like chemotaxis protein